MLSGLVAFAALYAIPQTARAQIFETNIGNNTIGEYRTLGGTVDPALVSGFGPSYGIAVSEGYLFVTDYDSGTIGK